MNAIENFRNYTATVKTDESYYGDCNSREAEKIADRITRKLWKQFPGINVRVCHLIGRGNLDETRGPKADVCESIDRFVKSIAI